jgi:uncharacterized protein YndB with AHSA1/START domain
MSVPESFVIDYELAQAPSKVWRVLTEPELLKRWLMENDIRPVVGHKFTFRAQPQPWWDGVVHCEILEVEPESRLRYSWRGGALDTMVTWTLRPSKTGGTFLRLEHTGFSDKDQFAYKGMSEGWAGKIADRLKELVATLG